MPALAHTTDGDRYTRAANDDCIFGGPRTRTKYDYDAFGNLNRITDAIGAVSTSVYNLRGFMTQMIDADAGTWNFDGNSLNELVSWRDAKNQLFGAEYDPLGRMTSRTESGETSDWTWGSSATLDNIGRLEKVAGYGYSEQMFYDSIGRLSTRRITSDTSDDYDYTYNHSRLQLGWWAREREWLS